MRLASKYLTLMNKTQGVAISRLRQADSLSYSGVEIRRISVAGDLSESNVEYKTSFLFYLLLIVRTTYRSGIRKTSNVPPRLRIIPWSRNHPPFRHFRVSRPDPRIASDSEDLATSFDPASLDARIFKFLEFWTPASLTISPVGAQEKYLNDIKYLLYARVTNPFAQFWLSWDF